MRLFKIVKLIETKRTMVTAKARGGNGGRAGNGELLISGHSFR